MESKKDTPIIALKLKNGDDVIGYYMGETEALANQESTIILYRPVKIQLMNSLSENGVSVNYIPTLYFPYGESRVHILVSQIVQKAIANSFFSRFYVNILSDLLLTEDVRHMRMLAVFDDIEERNIMKNTKSAYISPENNTLQ